METLKGIVQKIVFSGKHGPYAVTTVEGVEGSVTFSLDQPVWAEADWPQEGMQIHLSRLQQKRSGWRAAVARYWTPSDEQTQQPAKSKGWEFLYPISRQYPFDEVCEKIVRELEKRNWNVPGMEVEFDDYGSGEQMFRMVRKISGADFKLHFCRPQRLMPGGRWNDTAAVSELWIPKNELHVYDDESGPTFYFYVGRDWEKDRQGFMNGLKVHSKMNKKPRTYLRYSARGSYRSPSSQLMHENDCGREHDPRPLEPKFFKTAKVLRRFQTWLEQNVLPIIMAEPISEQRIDTLAQPEPIPMPTEFKELFCFADHETAERIRQGTENPYSLPLADRHAKIGSFPRLVPYGVNDKPHPVPDVAFEGFMWCGIGEVTPEATLESLQAPGVHRSYDERFVVRIKPDRANDIYIADHGAYEKRRLEIMEVTKDRDRFTNAEVNDFICARGRTIIPLTEYKGGFEQPVVLIKRQLDLTEAEVVSGPHGERFR